MLTKKTYYTHDNGGRPFKVIIDDNKVFVYKREGYNLENYSVLYSEKSIKYLKKNFFECKKIFIGKSPLNEMTKFSGGYGKDFNGNSILLELENNKYIFIGSIIYSFESHSKIVIFKSPVGNSDVPYPYAIDNAGRYYLMIEDVVIDKFTNKKEYDNDPYNYYYEKKSIANILNIKNFYIGNKIFNLTYTPDASKNYKWISSWDDFKDGMRVEYFNGTNEILTKQKYNKIMKKVGNILGFSLLKKRIIQKRLW